MSSQRSEGQDSAVEGCLTLCGFVAYFVAIWICIETWPWSLFVPLVGFAIKLFVNGRFRRNVFASFTTRHHSELDAFRTQLSWTLFLLGVFASVVCGFAVGTQFLEWWLIPVGLLIPALILFEQSPTLGRFLGALRQNALELLWMAGGVLMLYSLLAWRVQSAALNEATLDQLSTWDKWIKGAHECLETHQPGLGALSLFAIAVILLRMWGEGRSSVRSLSTHVASIFAHALKWLGRTSTTLAVAASLTLLATGEGGFTRRISLTLRDAEQEYKQFQSTLSDKVELVLRQNLIVAAWQQRPALLVAEMREAAEVETDRARYVEAGRTAKERFGIDPEQVAQFSISPVAPERAQNASHNSRIAWNGSWTLDHVHDIAAQAAALDAKAAAKDEATHDENSEELVKKTWEHLLPFDKVIALAPALDALKTHYPVFGEFFDVITSSISESSFDAMRDSIVSRVSKQSAHDLATATSKEAKELIKNVRFDWSRFGDHWQTIMSLKLRVLTSQIASGLQRLALMASEEQRKRIAGDVKSVEEREDLMAKAGQVTSNKALEIGPSIVDRARSALESLAMTWPALGIPSRGQLQSLRQIEADTRARLPDYALVIVPQIALGISSEPSSEVPRGNLFSRSASNSATYRTAHTMKPQWQSPLDGLRSLVLYCDERLLVVVVDRSPYDLRIPELKQKLGEHYKTYDDLWQTRVRAEREKKVREQQQEAIRIGVRPEFEEGTHGAEHPVEIP